MKRFSDMNWKMRRTFYILLFLAVLICGCSSTSTHPDPLAGWEEMNGSEIAVFDKAISNDYRTYIQNLPTRDHGFVGPISYFKSKSGEHAIRMEVFVKGKNASWYYVLIYNKEDRRIRAIRYGFGRYQS